MISNRDPIVEKARLLAIKAHGEQKYGDLPYEYHLSQVFNILIKYEEKTHHDRLGDAVLAAGWLHDVIEDTDITFRDVWEEFGRYVARIVFACTDEEGKNRKERHERTYPKLRAAGRDAIAVKLADRIANCKHSQAHNHSMLKMYQKEYPEFKAYLHLPGELKELWATLDVLMEHPIEPQE